MGPWRGPYKSSPTSPSILCQFSFSFTAIPFDRFHLLFFFFFFLFLTVLTYSCSEFTNYACFIYIYVYVRRIYVVESRIVKVGGSLFLEKRMVWRRKDVRIK